VRARDEHRTVLMALSGELDLAASPLFEEELDRIRDGVDLVILDLRELDFMDSTGLTAVIKAHQRCHDSGQRLVLIRGPQQVQRLLTLTGVKERLTIVDSPEELSGQQLP
jgi:anti-anti-sigma factor